MRHSNRVKVDEASATVTYIGVTKSNGLVTDPIWFVTRITALTGNDWDIEKPTGITSGKAVWNDRVTYTYG